MNQLLLIYHRYREKIFLFPAFLFLLPLGAFILMGSYMRYSGDDYCYGMIVTERGFLRAQVDSYLNVALYHGDRFSLTFFSGLPQFFGPKANGIMPGLAVVLLVIGFYLTLRKAAALLLKFQFGRVVSAALACIAAFFTLYLSPDVYQFLYWRSGMLPYLAPSICFLFIAAIILSEFPKKRSSLSVFVGLFLLSIMSGGFSETGVVVQAAALALGLLAIIIVSRKRSDDRRNQIYLLITAMLGVSCAFALMLLSPVAYMRMANLPPRPDLPTLLSMFVRFPILFTYSTITGLIMPFFVFFVLTGSLASFLFLKRPAESFVWKRWLTSILVVLGTGLFLIAASMAPSEYLQSSYPELRTLGISTIVLVVTGMILIFLLVLGVLSIVQTRKARRFLAGAAAFLVFVSSLYSFRAVPNILNERDKFQRWAMFWDQRDQQIRGASASGIQSVEVVSIEHVIPNVGDLSADDGYWYNNCAEGYYGVISIRANQPGWDDHP